MASTRGERLRTARKRRFKSARTAALALGVPISTYGAHERAQLPGGRDYGTEDARHYARRLGVTVEWLLTGMRHAPVETWAEPEDMEKPVRRLVPIVGYVGAGTEAHYYDVSPGYLDEVEFPRLVNDATHIFQVRDHGLGSIFNRWLVFFDEVRSPVTPDLFGYLCVVGLDDGRILIRMLQPAQTPGRFDLLSEFAMTFRDVAVSWAAKVTTLLPP